MKKFLLCTLLLALNFYAFGQATDLIISEYVEGSSNNKYIELYNGTGGSIDLSNYQIQKHTNGGSGSTSTQSLSGMLADGTTYVIANGSANATITAAADLTANGVIGYNGDDVVELQKDNGTGTFVIIDVIGENTGVDPGTGWDVAGTSNATANHTLVRKNTICSPNVSWSASSGTNATNSEWVVTSQDDFSNIGTHSQDCTLPTVNFDNATSNQMETNVILPVMIPVTMANYGGSQVDLSVAVTGGTAAMTDYTLNTSSLSFTANGTMNVSIDINPDADNLDETIEITITETTTTGVVINASIHTISITDDECSISNVAASVLSCNGDDAQFTVTWTGTNTSGMVEVDINGHGYQTITSGGTYTMTGPTTAAAGVTVTVRDFNDNACMATSTVDIPTCPFAAPNVVINEVDCDQTSSDANEFIELYGTANQSLDGLVIVLFNGNGDASYKAFDLDGESLDANGFFTLGSSAVVGANMNFSSATGNLQNGADAVALYLANATDFPNGTAATTTNLIDAIVYDTDDSDDSGLLTNLGQSTQYNENENGNKETESIQRFPDGAANFVIEVATPTSANLPVELMSFTANLFNKEIVLNWSTASEENNNRFEVEHSTNGIDFKTIGEVAGMGTTYEIQEYSFVDNTPIMGLNYYRLRQVDFDGRFEYSDIISINMTDENVGIVTLNPTQVNQQFNLIFSNPIQGKIELNIYSINGQIVKSEILMLDGYQQMVRVNDLQAGVYIVKMNVNNQIVTKRFVKQ